MIIRNKFNGYGFDGTRLCHDPVSLSIAATQAGAASSAAAAALAAKTAAATTAATTAATAAAGKTAALELAKKEAITAGMKQAGTEAAKQGIAQAGQQVGVEAAKQTGVEAAKQGIFSANPAGMPPTAGAPITPTGPATPLAPAGNAPPMSPADMAARQAEMETARQNAARELAARGGNVQGTAGQAADPLRTTYSTYPSQTYNPATGGVDNVMRTTSTPPFNAANAPVANAPITTPDPSLGGFSQNYIGAAESSKGLTLKPGMADTLGQSGNVTQGINVTPDMAAKFGTPPPQSALQKGFETGLNYVKDNPVSTGLGLMTAGQYMNKPKEEDKDKYKNTVDMSGFQVSDPVQRPFTRSYEYQGYAVGGPVEQMAAMNAVGTNTGYPQAGLQTPMYSNPAMQRPQAANVVAPSADAGVNTYTGEARFAEGGLSAAQRREYGLSTRGQRASRNLSKSYEEMEAERQKEAMRLFGERSDPGIVPRSRTQMMSSPFSAAMAEHARLGKKSKVPVVEMPKTNLGDIDNYMDIPIEAAGGGIMHGLGGYSDGGRLLRGPGDGVSDSIPAVIGKRQPARLADGEFVIPARIVSELGNGSTEAGARKLYAMMERVQASRKKSIGKKKVAVNSKSDKHLPA